MRLHWLGLAVLAACLLVADAADKKVNRWQPFIDTFISISRGQLNRCLIDPVSVLFVFLEFLASISFPFQSNDPNEKQQTVQSRGGQTFWTAGQIISLSCRYVLLCFKKAPRMTYERGRCAP